MLQIKLSNDLYREHENYQYDPTNTVYIYSKATRVMPRQYFHTFICVGVNEYCLQVNK